MNIEPSEEVKRLFRDQTLCNFRKLCELIAVSKPDPTDRELVFELQNIYLKRLAKRIEEID